MVMHSASWEQALVPDKFPILPILNFIDSNYL